MENKRSLFIKSLIKYSIVTWISFLISFVATPISTRLFSPDKLGQINLFTTYATLASTFVYLGLDQTYVRFYNEPPEGQTNKTLLTFCIEVSSVVSLMIGVILVFFWRPVSNEILGRPSIWISLSILLYVFSTFGFRYINLSSRMAQDLKMFTIQGVAYALFNKIFYLFVAFWSSSSLSAIVTLAISNIILTIIFFVLRRSSYDFRLTKTISKPFICEISRFSLPLLPIAFLLWANSSLSNVILKQLLGFETVGIYSTAVVLSNSLNIIQGGFNAYWAPYVYQNYKNKDSNGFWTIHKLISTCLTFLCLFMVLFQPLIFLLVGRQYRDAMIFFPLLLVSPLCATISETTGLGINISKKTYWNTVVFFINIVINIAFCFILIPIFGVSGAAMTSAIVAIVSLLIRTIIGENYYKSVKNYFYLISSLGIVCTSALVNSVFYNMLLIKNLFLVGLILLASILFRKELLVLWNTGFEFILPFIKSRTKKEE